MVFGISLLSCSSQKKSSTNNKGTEQTTTSSSSQGKSGNQQDSQKKDTTENKDKLTLDDIKAKYTGGVNGKLIDVTTYESPTISNGRYVLVEYLSDGGYYLYDWYNLVTGMRSLLSHTMLN